MDTKQGTYTYTHDNQKYKVPIERVYSISQLDKADHIAFERLKGTYWHHAIVEDVETENSIINVIEYSNDSLEFVQDNCSPPKNPGIAKVRRSKYNGLEDDLYLIKHKECNPADIVVGIAISRLGENKFHPLTNNCEHFAMSCKTGISSSEQVKRLIKRIEEETAKKGASMAAKRGLAQTVSHGGGQIAKEALKAAKQGVAQTVSHGGGQIAKEALMAAKQGVAQTVSHGGGQIAKEALMAAKQGVAQTVSHGGQEIAKGSAQMAAKQGLAQTAKKAGEEIVAKGTRETTREVVTQTSKTTGNSAGESLVGGAAFAVVFETASAVYDIYRTNKDLKTGNISEKEYNDAVGKRIVGGVGNVTGAVVGQVLFPFGGGFVGSVVGGLAGRFLGDALWDGAE